MDIKKGNNRTAIDYYIISMCYVSSTIAPTSLHVKSYKGSSDYELKVLSIELARQKAFHGLESTKTVCRDDVEQVTIIGSRQIAQVPDSMRDYLFFH